MTGLALASAAVAQVVVPPSADPSVILRNNTPPKALPAPPDEPARATLTEPIRPAPAAATSGETRFKLLKVEASPSLLLSPADLSATWAPYLDQEISLKEVRQIIAAINDLYWRQGHYAAQASLPAQQIKEGVLKLNLVEGKVERVTVESGDPAVSRLGESVLDLAAGDLFVGPQVQQRLARFNRGSDTRFYAVLRPGKAPGTTEVIAQVEMQPRYDLAASLHNEASDSVGRNQFEVTGYARRLLTTADRLGAIVQKSKGATNVLALYSLPVNGMGTRLGASLSSGRTSTVSSGLGRLEVLGRSNVVGLSLTQALPVWKDIEFDVSLNSQRTRTHTDIEGFSIGDSTSRMNSLGLQSVYRAPAHLVSVYSAFNRVAFDGADGVSRNVSSTTINGSWAWVFSEAWWLNTRFGLQFTSDVDVPSAVKFSIGNPGDVRGYPSSVVFGDKGRFLSVEMHRRFAGNTDAFAFLDDGVTTTDGVPKQALRSLGLGVSTTYGKDWTLTASLAKPLLDAVPGQASVRALVRLTWQFN